MTDWGAVPQWVTACTAGGALGVAIISITSHSQNDGGGKDVFVHISAVERAGLSDLREGAKVTFDIVSNRGKEAAENLKVK